MTTPYEREILTHYYTHYNIQFPRYTAPLYAPTVEKFVQLGLLIRDPDGTVRGNDEALTEYMDALANVPLPTEYRLNPNQEIV